MPRKEDRLPIEERIQRAKEQAELREEKEKTFLAKLYATPLYRYARKSCIAFLWVSQLMLIDWALPYLEEKDRINGGYFNANTMQTQGIGGITDFRLTDLFIKTEKGYQFKVDFTEGDKEPSVGDSVVILKSLIFHDFKKMYAPRVNESYYVSTSATYRFLPFMFIVSGMAIMFIFVKNIEVKAFAWLSLLCTLAFGLFLVGYMVMSFRH